MIAYHTLLHKILATGEDRTDRTGVGTRSIFGHQMRFDLQKGFPLLTTKKLFLRGIIVELLWFLRGETHVSSLQEQRVKIWDDWATKEECAKFGREEGELGPIYGHQWRNFGATLREDGTYANDGVDQIKKLVENIKKTPSSRRLIVSAWNPKEADQVTLPPCHTLFQFYVSRGRLSCQLYQRSADVFLGLPFNIASYALLTLMIAQCCDLGAGEFVHTLGDAHLYSNHIELAEYQITRAHRPLPHMFLHPDRTALEDFTLEDFALENYNPHPHIPAKVAV